MERREAWKREREKSWCSGLLVWSMGGKGGERIARRGCVETRRSDSKEGVDYSYRKRGTTNYIIIRAKRARVLDLRH